MDMRAWHVWPTVTSLGLLMIPALAQATVAPLFGVYCEEYTLLGKFVQFLTPFGGISLLAFVLFTAVFFVRAIYVYIWRRQIDVPSILIVLPAFVLLAGTLTYFVTESLKLFSTDDYVIIGTPLLALLAAVLTFVYGLWHWRSGLGWKTLVFASFSTLLTFSLIIIGFMSGGSKLFCENYVMHTPPSSVSI